MPTVLPRLKPSPVPAVNAVPEYLAEGDLKADYEDTKAVLQVPWMGVVAMAFASFRNLYGAFWPHFRQTFAGRELVEACASLRADAEAAVLALEPPSAVPRLTELGYAPRELDQIRDMVEVFSHGNFPYCFMATMTRLLLEGQELENRQAPAAYSGRHAQTAEYEALVARIHQDFVSAALTLPNPDGLTAEELRAAAKRDSPDSEVLDVVRLFQWLLPGLIANVAYFRAQLQA
jgi:hypothetical protein